ncbi:outer membrane transport energization protein TonB [Archangium gephyra]|nr:energy transducer TonB [Archangium gephyra]REG14250.1 outer membrane transport energization protein TonB [Archangium gephyra]
MILNFHIGMQDVAPTARQDARPPVGLFRMGEATSTGERERWAWALFAAGLVHAVVLIVGLTLPHSAPKAATLPEEPEVVFFSFPPPPAAASSATAATAPERVKRQARTRAPRVVPTLALKTPVPEPVEAPVETANPETVRDTPPDVEEPPAGEGSPGVQGVVAGIVGGALDGREGGLLGATGGSALELKQVARAPEVLAQVQPRYPRRAKADGIQGLVLVRIIIGTDGRVEPEHTRVIRSVPELDAAAISAVSQWRFSPALGHHGRPVRVIVEIPVQFSLK